MYNIQFKAAIITGVTEVIVTHPIDYIKTISQSNNMSTNKINYYDALKTPYKGVISRLVGVVPMRFIFWNSLEFFKNKKFSSLQSGILTSIVQTTIDYPIEQIKTKQILNNTTILNSFFSPKCKCNINIISAFNFHLIRNMGFAVCFNKIIQLDNDSLYYGAVGGFVGSVLTQPFDSLKTWYQVGNMKYPKHWSAKHYMIGWHYRCMISLLSMNIGWIIFHRIKD
jgi:hypothetical protein